MCIIAADIEAGLSLYRNSVTTKSNYSRHLLKAAILYDLAGLPGASARISNKINADERIKDFFSRRKGSIWGNLLPPQEANLLATQYHFKNKIDYESLLIEALGESFFEQALLLHEGKVSEDKVLKLINSISRASSTYNLEFNGDDFHALLRTLRTRKENSSLALLSKISTLRKENLDKIGTPLEFWPVQKKAIEDGLLSSKITSYGLAAPTGTGKTSLARIAIAKTVLSDSKKRVIYISPSRALVHQVAKDLSAALSPIGIHVKELGAHLTVHEQLSDSAEIDAQVLVFTPERADLLLRIDQDFVSNISLVLVDEAHHIEQGSRGILLEFYLWRLRKLIPNTARVVQLSAVTPNILDLVSWLGNSEQISAVKVDWRTNRLRLGTFDFKSGTGDLKFNSLPPISILEEGCASLDRLNRIATLAQKLSTTGIVLVLCTSVKMCEEVAQAIANLSKAQLNDAPPPHIEILDAKIERELYPESPLRSHINKRVAFHHAQLPPSVRISLEEAISQHSIDIVCATTTLAEGVNFPFSTVLVESLVGKNYQITPRGLWNIAGRAGRFGVDSEGHCIIFEPETFDQKLENFKLPDYLINSLDAIPPVKSALGIALTELKQSVDCGAISTDALQNINLGSIKIDNKNTALAKRIRGLVNLVRVGYTHASVSGISSLDSDGPESEISSEMLASLQVNEEVKAFANEFCTQQKKVIRSAFSSDPELMQIAARIGWSLEAQEELHGWLISLENWQIERFGNVVVGGNIPNFQALGYLLGPVSKFMSEFEGEKLGGITSFISCIWIEGVPLTSIRDRQKNKDLGELVRIIYSKVQYLLPWALYGVNELLQYEAKRRKIKILDGVKDLSVLAAEGVPNFDALQLVLGLGLERVDATRIASSYRNKKIRTTDIIGYFRSLEWNELFGIVFGIDRRRIDPDLNSIWKQLRAK